MFFLMLSLNLALSPQNSESLRLIKNEHFFINLIDFEKEESEEKVVEKLYTALKEQTGIENNNKYIYNVYFSVIKNEKEQEFGTKNTEATSIYANYYNKINEILTKFVKEPNIESLDKQEFRHKRIERNLNKVLIDLNFYKNAKSWETHNFYSLLLLKLNTSESIIEKLIEKMKKENYNRWSSNGWSVRVLGERKGKIWKNAKSLTNTSIESLKRWNDKLYEAKIEKRKAQKKPN